MDFWPLITNINVVAHTNLQIFSMTFIAIKDRQVLPFQNSTPPSFFSKIRHLIYDIDTRSSLFSSTVMHILRAQNTSSLKNTACVPFHCFSDVARECREI